MKNNGSDRRNLLPLLWPSAFLGAGGVLGLWLALGDAAHVLPALAVVALTAVLGGVWLSRALASLRRSAAVDAYAEREIARARREKFGKGAQSVPARGAV